MSKSTGRVVVSGGSGFVGKPTIKALKAEGYEVFNYDLTEGLDIRDYTQLISKINFGDKILHLAAIARFAEADADPKLAFETNVQGTLNVARAARELACERIVFSSTGSVYMPIKTEPPIMETDKAIGNSVYGCTKNLGEIYVRESTIPYVILRYAHLYGEFKLGHGLVGGFLDRIQRGLAPELYGGKQGNDFCYIKDIVDANILALETENTNESYNIGTGEELTAEEAGKIVCKIVGYKGDIDKKLGRTVDPQRFVYDMTKTEKLLGFKARYSFEDGLKDYLVKDEK